MNNYLVDLINQYKNQQPIEWEKVNSLTSKNTINYDSLNEINNLEILNQVAVLKLNGGLGTSMGCTGPKSAIPIKNNLSFLEIITKQIESINKKYKSNIPLVLMNSLNTEEETKKLCSNSNIKILHFNQNFLPRLNQNFEPLVNKYNKEENNLWYPPGHGDIYNALLNSDTLIELKKLGIKYVFISNSDNLGATFDTKILQFMDDNKKDFVMEVVEKTLADVKGGTLIEYENRINLLEVAQVPEEHLDEFYNIEKFKYFNTNNIWLNLGELNDNIKMEVIYNPKKLNDGTPVIQLEIAMGSAIKSFQNSAIINVPRYRFRPVKKCQDLFLIESGLFELDKDYNIICKRDKLPIIKFSNNYKKLVDYKKAFINGIPDIDNLISLELSDFRTFNETKLEGELIF